MSADKAGAVRMIWKSAEKLTGRIEVLILFGVLSVTTQFGYWSRIVSGLNKELG
jgi:hypothetical protein